MPELPEVEVVRRGLSRNVNGALITGLQVLNARAVRQNVGDLSRQITGATIHHVSRRGKYLWFVLDRPEVLVAHLGMSGQFRIHDSGGSTPEHLRVNFQLRTSAVQSVELQFIDQRTFGGMYLSETQEIDGGELLPRSITHIARDPLDPRFDSDRFIEILGHKRVEVKRVLLDQTVISGVGNIYADESLFRAGIHGSSSTGDLKPRTVRKLLEHVTDVMNEALVQGGTSFDSLYVNVNGESGYFSRSLDVYGREGEPCSRCGASIVRVKFMNRSSHFCPKCQPDPSVVAHR